MQDMYARVEIPATEYIPIVVPVGEALVIFFKLREQTIFGGEPFAP